jgi:hypothetical protein
MRIHNNILPHFIYLFVYRILGEKPPNVDVLLLTESNQPTDGLRFASFVYLLGWCQKWRKEDGVVCTSQVGSTRTFIHYIQQQDALIAAILEFLQGLGFCICRATDLQKLDFMMCQRLCYFLHEIRKLHKNQCSLFPNFFPKVGVVAMERVGRRAKPT